MHVRCGLDLIELDRIEKALKTHGGSFKNKVFTQGERDYCESRGAGEVQSFAARFCAKEAVVKALGTGISQGISLQDVEVVCEAGGKPRVVLHNEAKRIYENLGSKSIDISLTHSRDYAAAQVVILSEKE